MPLNPEKYLDGLANGIVPIIQRIYDNMFPQVASFVKNNKGTLVDAEDIFQKSLMQIIARYRIRPFSISHTFEGYFFTVCKNLWRRELKRRKKEVTNQQVLELENKNQNLTMCTLEQEKWEIFNENLQALSENCKTILSYFFNKKPYSEIMELMGYTSDNVVRQRIFKCKKKLTELIKEDPKYKLINKQ